MLLCFISSGKRINKRGVRRFFGRID